MDITNLLIVYLFCLGFYCVITEKNLIKIAVGINIMEAAILLFLVSSASIPGASPPIINSEAISVIVDPIPHALSLTAIVIGAGTTGFLLSLIIRLYEHAGTVRLDNIKEMK